MKRSLKGTLRTLWNRLKKTPPAPHNEVFDPISIDIRDSRQGPSEMVFNFEALIQGAGSSEWDQGTNCDSVLKENRSTFHWYGLFFV